MTTKAKICTANGNARISHIFHRMGHHVCSCGEVRIHPSAMIEHLRDHARLGDAIDQRVLAGMIEAREGRWDQAAIEGKRTLKTA